MPAGATIGTLRPALARETGLSPRTRVLAGIHDSNASFLCHRAGRESGEPFTVLSSGTWTIILANGGALDALDESRDCLANVDAYGEPTASARFMGGREYAAIAGDAAVAPTRADLSAALARGAMALPSFAEAGGPFPGRRGRLVDAGGLAPGERAALASLYLALMSDVSLNLLSSRGPIAVEGPLAQKHALRRPPRGPAAGPAGPPLRRRRRHGRRRAAPRRPRAPARSVPPAAPLDDDRLGAYRDLWRARAEERGPWSM